MEEVDELEVNESEECGLVTVSSYFNSLYFIFSLSSLVNSASFKEEGRREGYRVKEAERHFATGASKHEAPRWLFATAADIRGGVRPGGSWSQFGRSGLQV